MPDSAHQTMVPFQTSRRRTAGSWSRARSRAVGAVLRRDRPAGAGGRRALRRLRAPRPNRDELVPELDGVLRDAHRRPSGSSSSAPQGVPVRAGQRRRGGARRPAGGGAGRRGRVRPSGARRRCAARRSPFRLDGATPPARARAVAAASTRATCCATCAATTKSGSPSSRRPASSGRSVERRSAETGSGAAGSWRTSRSATSTAAGSAGRSARPTTRGSRCLTMNTNQMHFNREYAARTEFGEPLVVSTLTLAVVLGLSVADTSENAVANLGWGDIKLPSPVVRGRHALGRVRGAAVRESRSRPICGIVGDPHARPQPARRGRDRVHAELHGLQGAMRRRSTDVFPATDAPWTVGAKD